MKSDGPPGQAEELRLCPWAGCTLLVATTVLPLNSTALPPRLLAQSFNLPLSLWLGPRPWGRWEGVLTICQETEAQREEEAALGSHSELRARSRSRLLASQISAPAHLLPSSPISLSVPLQSSPSSRPSLPSCFYQH